MKQIELGINFLIEKNIKPLSADALFDILIKKEYFENTRLANVFLKSCEMQKLADATKSFVRCFPDNTKFPDADLIKPYSEQQINAYYILQGCYNKAIRSFASGDPIWDKFERYLVALVLLSFCYVCEDYFEWDTIMKLLDFCSRERIWF